MSYRIGLIAAVGVACLVSAAQAQGQADPDTRNTPSLIQRFEKFRDNLLGPAEQQGNQQAQQGRQDQQGARSGSVLNSRGPTPASPRTARRSESRRPETANNRPTSLKPVPTGQREPSEARPRPTLRRPVSAKPSFSRPSSQKSRSPVIQQNRSQQNRSSAPTATARAAEDSRRLAGGSRYRPSGESKRASNTPSGTTANKRTAPRVAKSGRSTSDTSPETRLRGSKAKRPSSRAPVATRTERTRRGSVNPYVNTEPVRTARVEKRTSKTALSRRSSAADLAKSINESSKTHGVVRRPSLVGKGDGDDEMLFTRHSPKIVVETAGPRQINVGRTAVYKVRVTNEGDSEVENTVVSVDVPSWAEIVGVEATLGDTRLPTSSDDTGISWTIDRIAAGSDEMMTLRLIPRESRTFDLAVRYTVSPPASQTLVEVQEPKLSMVMSGPSEVFYGEQIVYKLTVSNPGSGDAENVVVRLLPGANSDAATAQHTLGLIPAGESRVMELELNARQAGKMLIHAESSGDGGLTASVREDVLVRRAQLDVEMTGPEFQYAGTEATYKLRVINPGNATAQDVEITSMLPPGTKYIVSSGGGRLDDKESSVLWKLSSLQPGAEHVFELKCQPGMSGVNRHEVVATAAGGLRNATVLTTEVEALADLELNVKDPRGPVPVAQSADFEIVVRNRGAEVANGVEVVAYFSEGIEPIAVKGGGNQVLPGQVIFDVIPTIGAGKEVTLVISAKASKAGNHSFRVELRCDSLDTRLATEETTRFFTNGSRSNARVSSASPSNGEPQSSAVKANQQSAPLQPIPAGEDFQSVGPTPAE